MGLSENVIYPPITTAISHREYDHELVDFREADPKTIASKMWWINNK